MPIPSPSVKIGFDHGTQIRVEKMNPERRVETTDTFSIDLSTTQNDSTVDLTDTTTYDPEISRMNMDCSSRLFDTQTTENVPRPRHNPRFEPIAGYIGY